MSVNETATEKDLNEVEKINTSELPSMMDFKESLSTHAHTLRALGALLESSDLMTFADEGLVQQPPQRNEYSSNMRQGLSQLIDLYLEKQEMIVAEFNKQYERNDYVVLKSFEDFIQALKNGMLQKFAAIERLEHRLEEIEPIIEGSDEFRDRARRAKQEALDFIATLKGKGIVKHEK